MASRSKAHWAIASERYLEVTLGPQTFPTRRAALDEIEIIEYRQKVEGKPCPTLTPVKITWPTRKASDRK